MENLEMLRKYANQTEGKLKIGVFGARRGKSLVEPAVLTEKGYVYAVCDYDESTYEAMKDCCCEETKFYKDFDEFIKSGMDVVFLANYFNEHAKFAIKALEMGIHVYSETIPAVTMVPCGRKAQCNIYACRKLCIFRHSYENARDLQRKNSWWCCLL